MLSLYYSSVFQAAIYQLLIPFALICVIVLSIQLVGIGIGAQRQITSFSMSVTMTSAWLFFPMLLAIYKMSWSSQPQLTISDAFLTFVGSSLLLGIGSWIVSPLLILFCVVSRRMQGPLTLAIPFLILLVGLPANWLMLHLFGYIFDYLSHMGS